MAEPEKLKTPLVSLNVAEATSLLPSSETSKPNLNVCEPRTHVFVFSIGMVNARLWNGQGR